MPASEKDPDGWGATDKFTVVLETAGLKQRGFCEGVRHRAQRLLPGAGLVPRAGGALAAGIPGCQREASAHLERAEGARTTPCPGAAGNQAAQTGAQAEGAHLGGGGSTAVADRFCVGEAFSKRSSTPQKKIQAIWGEVADD